MKKQKKDEGIVGKIHSVRCRDFVTYDSVVMYPGQHLNLLIGPNGTGKSTLVAAIILGLAGHPKHLSRSSNLNEYVKNGKETAWIQIKLYKSENEDLITFERTFGAGRKATFKVDGRDVSQDEYRKQIRKFNIYIDNLCQFLPQDRVQDFAKLNHQELLESTQNSVCSTEMVESFAKLKDLRNNQKKAKSDMVKNIKLLTENQQKLSEMEGIVEQIAIRRRLLKEINICNKKKQWLECQKIVEKIDDLKRDLLKAKESCERDKRLLQEINEQTKAFEEFQKKLEGAGKVEAQKAENYSKAIEDVTKMCEELESSIRRAKIDFESKKADIAEKANELAQAERLFEAAISDLNNAREACGSEEERREQIVEFQRQLNDNRAEIGELSSRYRLINRRLDEDFQAELGSLKHKIHSMENVDERKMNNLRHKFPDVYQAVVWVRQNQHMFDNQVFEPMTLELKIRDSVKNAKYIENIVSRNDLTAFNCVSKDDMNLLVQKLCTEMKLKVSVVHSPAADRCTYRPRMPIDNLRHLGFTSYLLDLIDGPAPLLNNLCRYYKINDVLIGDSRVNSNTDKVPDHIRVYFADNYRYQITKSRYSNETSSMRQTIGPRNLMEESIDGELLTSYKRKFNEIAKKSDLLKNERSEIQGQINEKEEIQRRIQTAKKEFESKSIKVQEYKQQCKRLQQKVESIKSRQIDIEEEERKFKAICVEKVKKRLEAERKRLDQLVSYEESFTKYNYYRAKMNVHKTENIDLENKKRSAVTALSNSTGILEAIKSTATKEQKKLNSKKDEVKADCEGKLPTDSDFPYKREFNKLPESLEHIVEHSDKLQSRVECIGSENTDLLAEYKERRKAVEELTKLVNAANQSEKEVEDEIKELFTPWFEEMNKVMDVINTNFSTFMSSMGYSGEVKLHWTDEKDYSSYGIQILVKYRDSTKLQILDRYVQSGGERAVAIAVYTLSIQHISHVPFRCVDEINQGMDPRNERKVFEMLVEQTAAPGKAQYFFVTPKLLPNLDSNEYMDVHVVYNGKLDEDTKFYPFE